MFLVVSNGQLSNFMSKITLIIDENVFCHLISILIFKISNNTFKVFYIKHSVLHVPPLITYDSVLSDSFVGKLCSVDSIVNL